jgi:dipeptidyl aminopeptidase/acylaminoacyl peptidase
VRCRGCGAELADDVRGCPACNADAGESLPVVDLDDAELGIRTEDRYAYVPPGPKWIRRRVHHDSARIPIAILVGLVLFFLVGAWLQHPSHDGVARRREIAAEALPALRHSTRTSLLVLTPNGVQNLHVDRRELSSGAVAELPVGPVTAATTSGEHAVLVVDHRAYVVPLSLDGPAAGIGAAVEVFPSKRAAGVWLLTYPPDGSVIAREVDLGGAETTPPAVLGGSATVRTAAGAGLVIERLGPDGTRALATWDPAHPADAPVTLRSGALFVAGGQDTVASREAACPSGRCDLYLDDLGTGHQRVIGNALSSGGVAAAAFSHDGRRLAVLENDGDQSHGTLVDIETGSLTPFDAGPVATTHPAVAWSNDGAWLFVSTTAGRIDAVDARGRGYSVKTRRLDTAALVTR